MAKAPTKSGHVRVGIGGWTYPPWRGTFYPKGLPQAQELAYASTKLTSIEINATFYRLQTAASFRKWADAVPDGFVFSVKAPRLVTHRRVLAEGESAMQRFFQSGVLELGDRLGPILWQLAATKRFEEADFANFLERLPQRLDGQPLRHVVEVSHESFRDPAFIRLLRDFGVAAAYVENDASPAIADLTTDFVYARLQKGKDTIETGYSPRDLDALAERARLWAAGGEPDDLARADATHKTAPQPRDVFIYFIREGKLRAPAAAAALIERLEHDPEKWKPVFRKDHAPTKA
jgi:uncharacterized protein YecE (DUF72 family)